MSIQAVAYVLDSHIPDPSAKLVMISLANALNGKTGQCNPSIAQICNEASSSKSTVIRKLQWLAEQGWIEIIQQHDAKGRQLHNSYRLNLSEAEWEGISVTPSEGVNLLPPEGVKMKPRGVTADTGEGVTAETPLKEPEDITGNRSLSEPAVSDSPKQRAKREAYPQAFEDAWSGYPTDRNMSKKEAFDAWKRLDAEDRAALLASLPGFKAYCKAQPDYRPIHMCRYIKYRRFDGHQEQAAAASDSPLRSWSEDKWSKALAFCRERREWQPSLGPAPFTRGCMVPAHLLTDGDRQFARIQQEQAA